MRSFHVIRALFLLAVCAHAPGLLPTADGDIVHLKNGNRIEGEVRPGSQPGSLKVILDKGLELEFLEKDVEQVERKKPPVREFEEKLKGTDPQDLDALLTLADWARERKLRSKEEEIYRKVLDVDPNDPVARRELGFVVFKNRWVKEEELKTKHGLIQFRGDWMTAEEKERRLTEELKMEISDLLRGADSENRYIREYSIRKLMDYRDPRARAVVLKFLGDPREAVRVVSVQMLASLATRGSGNGAKTQAGGSPGRGSSGGSKGSSSAGNGSGAGKSQLTKSPDPAGKAKGKAPAPADPPPGPMEEEIARALLDRTFAEESPAVRSAIASALQKMRLRRFFELALETVSSSDDGLKRDRAAEGVVFVLRKDWVPELIRTLSRHPPGADPAAAGNPIVRSILQKVFREDFEYRAADWLSWWEKNRGRYTDE